MRWRKGWNAASSPTRPSPTASNRRRRSGASAKCSAKSQRHAGGSIKHDVSVPVAAVPAFIEEADAAVAALIPGARPLPFGHLGDGNIHYNVTQPVGADKADFLTALGRGERRRFRGGEEIRRLDLGRARHRRA